jgi:flagellar hook-length control protein FliK
LTQSTTIESPRLFLADLFLDTFSQNSQLTFNNQSDAMGQAFSQILDNKVKSSQEASSYTNNSLGLKQNDDVVRRSAVDELKRRTSEIGVPLENLSINNDEDLNRLKKVMKDSGLNEEQIGQVMDQLKEGPVTMDKVMAALSNVKQKSGEKLTLSEESLPLLGKFLKDVGFSAEKVNEIMNGLKAGQKFGAETLKNLLVKNGDQNMKNVDLSNADPENLKNLLSSLGVKDSDLEKFMATLKQSKGRISLEGFKNFLKSVERPKALQADQLNNIKDLISNLSLSTSLNPKLQFDRIVSLLQSMGDQQVNQNFMSDNPAIQALRGGAMSAQAVTKGTGAFGGTNQGQSEGFAANQDTMGKSPAASGAESSKSSQTGFSNRMSAEVAKQVAEKMVYQVRNNQHVVRMQLSPASLGRLSINMVVKDNTVQATIIADNPQVKEALEEQLVQLRDNLASSGLDLERFDVSCGQDNSQADSGTNNKKSSKFSSLLDGDELEENNVEDLSATPSSKATNSLVDRLV